MTLTINGEPRDFSDGLTLSVLVAQLGMKPDRVAVELNLKIVPRPEWERTMLKHGDKLEIVHFVGGGSGGADAKLPPEQGQEQEKSQQDWICPTCSLANTGNFCGSCGEKRLARHDLSIGHLVSHAGETLFHWDSRIFQSLRLLFSKPGFVAAEYVRGARKRHLHPLHIFVVANVLYFFLQPFTGASGLKTPLVLHTHAFVYSRLASRMVQHRITAKGVTEEEFTRSFDHVVDAQARSLVILMVPLGAVLLAILEIRKRRMFGEHLVLALQIYAFWLLGIYTLFVSGATLVLSILAKAGMSFYLHALELTFLSVTTVIMAVYVYFALRRFYGDEPWIAGVKAVVLSCSMFCVLYIYRFVLFFTALYAA